MALLGHVCARHGRVQSARLAAKVPPWPPQLLRHVSAEDLQVQSMAPPSSGVPHVAIRELEAGSAVRLRRGVSRLRLAHRSPAGDELYTTLGAREVRRNALPSTPSYRVATALNPLGFRRDRVAQVPVECSDAQKGVPSRVSPR